jgi:hypothetical protein
MFEGVVLSILERVLGQCAQPVLAAPLTFAMGTDTARLSQMSRASTRIS